MLVKTIIDHLLRPALCPIPEKESPTIPDPWNVIFSTVLLKCRQWA